VNVTDIENMDDEGRAALKASLRQEKEKVLADRLETQNRVTRGELVPRLLVQRVSGDIFAVHRSQFISVSESAPSLIAAALRRGGEEVRIVRISADLIYGGLQSLKKDMQEWLVEGQE
jgi:predicted phage tail protein